MGEWKSVKYPDGCLECGTTDRTHFGRGLCSMCYQREMRGHEMENTQRSLGTDVGLEQVSVSDDLLGDSGLVEGEGVAGDSYSVTERPPSLGLSAPTSGPPSQDAESPKRWARFFAKKEKQQSEPASTKERRPKVVRQTKRISSADTLADAWQGLGGLAVRSGKHVPLGRYMMFSSQVTGEILDDAVKGTPIDRLILQPVAKGRGRFDALSAVFGPPMIILAIERDPSKADMLFPILKTSIRNSLPLMAPAIKKIQKKEADIAAAAAEMGFDGDGDPADQIINMIFGDWMPPAPEPQPEPAETDSDEYATQAS